MPELPEVETTCMGLRRSLIGKRITEVFIRNYKLRYSVPNDFNKIVKNSKVLNVIRRGKYGIINLNNGQNIIFHLGMSGNIQIKYLDDFKFSKHDHIIIYFNDKSLVIYNDPRKFGFVKTINKSDIKNYKPISMLGPEPLEPNFNILYLEDKLKNKTQFIKVALMDQRIIAGLGNIYVNEVLYRAKISPKRKCKNISKSKLKLITIYVKKVLVDAIEAGGSSLKDYQSSNGKLGYFQKNFLVYDKEDKECIKCKTKIKKIMILSRSTYYCPSCQR